VYSGITCVRIFKCVGNYENAKNNSNKPTPKETSEGVEVLQTAEEINPSQENPLHVWGTLTLLKLKQCYNVTMLCFPLLLNI
jgi:hypothetical protein